MSGVRRTGTVIIGAGQAGLALSRSLAIAGHDHVVLERGRIGERWRSERWESLRLLTPNWLDALPGAPPLPDRDGFAPVAEFADHLVDYASASGAPVIEHAEVRHVAAATGRFHVDGDAGCWSARDVVIATGDCDVGALPAVAAAAPADVASLHSSRYRSPDALRPGAVLVVGAGPSGQQIALELRRAGRDVVLAAGRHARMPRRYRGRDVWAWLDGLGDLDRSLDELPDPEAARRTPSLPLSGTNGGERIDLGVLHEAGVVVTGRLTGFSGPRAAFDAGALVDEVAAAERRMRRVLGRIDEHADRFALRDGCAHRPPPITLPRGPQSLDLRASGVRTIVWATGYRRSYPWLRVPVLSGGEILHRHGATAVPGLHVLGMRFQHRRSSHLIAGVGADARLLAARLLGERDGLLQAA